MIKFELYQTLRINIGFFLFWTSQKLQEEHIYIILILDTYVCKLTELVTHFHTPGKYYPPSGQSGKNIQNVIELALLPVLTQSKTRFTQFRAWVADSAIIFNPDLIKTEKIFPYFVISQINPRIAFVLSNGSWGSPTVILQFL